MTSDRAYRGRLTPSEAVAELQRCAGTQFDPEIVAVFARELGYAPATAVAAG
jgi:HD-GYP domain-containing protein (c-di-GMP phosphodiesterase class II)